VEWHGWISLLPTARKTLLGPIPASGSFQCTGWCAGWREKRSHSGLSHEVWSHILQRTGMTRRLTDFSAVSYGERILKRFRCTFCRPGYRLSAAIDWGFWRHRLVMEAIIFFLVLTEMVRRIFTHASQLRRNAIFSCRLFIFWSSTKHHGTWRTAASTPQTLLVASICGPPAAISCSYRDTGVRCSVVGPFLCLVRRPGTRHQTTCEIRHVPLTVFAATWKLLFFRFTSVHSALEALRLCAT